MGPADGVRPSSASGPAAHRPVGPTCTCHRGTCLGTGTGTVVRVERTRGPVTRAIGRAYRCPVSRPTSQTTQVRPEPMTTVWLALAAVVAGGMSLFGETDPFSRC